MEYLFVKLINISNKGIIFFLILKITADKK